MYVKVNDQKFACSMICEERRLIFVILKSCVIFTKSEYTLNFNKQFPTIDDSVYIYILWYKSTKEFPKFSESLLQPGIT